MRDTAAELALAERAARAAGDFLKDRFAAARIVGDSRRDVKLSEDSEAEAIITGILAESGLPVLAEEGGGERDIFEVEAGWIVDPLDGSFNFNRGFDRCVVAIGLIEKGQPTAGVICDFLRGDLLSGRVGQGARRNGEPISVSAVTEAKDAAVVTGLPANRDFSGQSMADFSRRLARYKKVRMLGSAASSLMLVASGVFDLYEEEDIMIWDVAAGAALVKAAGGAIDMTPSPRVPHAVRIVAAANASLF